MKRLLFLFMISLILSACNTNTSEEENTQNSETTSPETTEKPETEPETETESKVEETPDDRLQFGDSAEIDQIELTVNDATFTEDRIPDHFETFEYVLKVNVTYENKSDRIFPAGRDITIKVNDRTEATYYDMEDTLLKDINPGESVTGDLYFAFNGQPKKITATFEPLLNTKGESAMFNVMPK